MFPPNFNGYGLYISNVFPSIYIGFNLKPLIGTGSYFPDLAFLHDFKYLFWELILAEFEEFLRFLTIIGFYVSAFFFEFWFLDALKFFIGTYVFLKILDFFFEILILLLTLTFLCCFLDLINATGKYFLPPIMIAFLFFKGIYFFPLILKIFTNLF